MEQTLNKTLVPCLSYALDAVSEQPVDIDFTLPDFCPDIEKLLRCRVTPKIYNRNLSGSQLNVDGNTVLTILYVDSDKGRVRACEQTVPFSASFKLREVPESCAVNTSVKCEYVNCRVLSRRRLSVHGAFSLYAKVERVGVHELFSPAEIKSMEYKRSELTASAMRALGSESFSVSDEIQVTGKPPVEIILDSETTARLNDFKILSDKLMLNGELLMKILYLSNSPDSPPERLECSIPFSDVVDCKGLDESCSPAVEVNVQSFDVRLKSDILSDNPLLSVDSNLSACVKAFKNQDVEIVRDAYSTEFFCEPQSTRLSLPVSSAVFSDNFMFKQSVELEDTDLEKAVDLRGEVAPLSCTICDGKLNLSSKLDLSLLAQNSSGEYFCAQRKLDIQKQLELPFDADSVIPCGFSLRSLSYILGQGGSLDIKAELGFSLLLQKHEDVAMVCSVKTDTEKSVQKNNSPLILYFAEAGESLWEISKRYKTSQNLVMGENNLDEQELEKPCMLFIPSV